MASICGPWLGGLWLGESQSEGDWSASQGELLSHRRFSCTAQHSEAEAQILPSQWAIHRMEGLSVGHTLPL